MCAGRAGHFLRVYQAGGVEVTSVAVEGLEDGGGELVGTVPFVGRLDFCYHGVLGMGWGVISQMT